MKTIIPIPIVNSGHEFRVCVGTMGVAVIFRGSHNSTRTLSGAPGSWLSAMDIMGWDVGCGWELREVVAAGWSWKEVSIMEWQKRLQSNWQVDTLQIRGVRRSWDWGNRGGTWRVTFWIITVILGNRGHIQDQGKTAEQGVMGREGGGGLEGRCQHS